MSVGLYVYLSVYIPLSVSPYPQLSLSPPLSLPSSLSLYLALPLSLFLSPSLSLNAISRHIVLMLTNVILYESCPRARFSNFFRATQNEIQTNVF